MSAAAAHFLEEPTAGRLTVRYAPDEGDVLAENPPRFSWLPVVDEGARYVLRVSTDEQFAAAQTREFKNLNWLRCLRASIAINRCLRRTHGCG